MKVLHLFLNFPNNKQPYNVSLIKRLQTTNVRLLVGIMSGNINSKLVDLALSHVRKNWLKYIYRSLKYYSLFRVYKHETGFSLKKSIYHFGRFSELLTHEIDIIHVHHLQILQEHVMAFFRIINIKIIVSVRGSDILVRPYRSQNDKLYIKNIFNEVDGIHVVSNHLKEEVLKYTKSSNKVKVIKRTVEIEDSEIVSFQGDSSPVTIATIGRIHWTKGYTDAIKALHLVNKAGYDFSYKICGSFEIENYDELFFYINKYKLSNKVVFMGHLNNNQINDVLKETSIYLQTSLTEGIPNTLTRALKLSIPVVSTNAGGISEVFQTSDSGFLLEVGDINGIANAIIKLIENKDIRDKIRSKKNLLLQNKNSEINEYIKMYQDIA